MIDTDAHWRQRRRRTVIIREFQVGCDDRGRESAGGGKIASAEILRHQRFVGIWRIAIAIDKKDFIAFVKRAPAPARKFDAFQSADLLDTRQHDVTDLRLVLVIDITLDRRERNAARRECALRGLNAFARQNGNHVALLFGVGSFRLLESRQRRQPPTYSRSRSLRCVPRLLTVKRCGFRNVRGPSARPYSGLLYRATIAWLVKRLQIHLCVGTGHNAVS